ncbi:tetratricopeptide repeat protein [Frigidibacter sp. MR17.24]|uniref:tetratricopeptide repeat protein n=1 Tax=Frigidibacter sp. MR17.24 TaxID=3127345 RepID=UPI00301309DB
MRHPVIASLCLGAAVLVAGCAERTSDAEVKRAVKQAGLVEENNISDIMLTVADPAEAVSYFTRTLESRPDDVSAKRGLAGSLVRAKRPTEAIRLWTEVADGPGGTADDRVQLADALIRANEWKQAEAQLNRVPPTHETYERYRLEAMVADYNKQWKKADSFYETAAGLTTRPANVLNNWGYSKLNRRDFTGAEKLFTEALTYDPTMFTAKNNLVMARAGQRRYDLPIVQMTQVEKAMLLYTAALTAIKQGDVQTGRSLLREAVETHPQHFEEASRALEALEGSPVTTVSQG